MIISLNKISIVILGIGLLVLVAVFYFSSNVSKKDLTKTIGEVTRGDFVQRVTIAGNVVPLKRSIVTAPYNGYIKKIFVKVGEKISMGHPIVSVVQSLTAREEAFPMRSPIEGVVVQIQKSEGQFVKEAESNEFILQIDSLEKLLVLAHVPEIDRAKLQVGQNAIIQATALPGQEYRGTVQELSLAARERERWDRSQVVEYPMKVLINNPDESLKSGMSVLLDVLVHEKKDVLMLRHEYIRREGNQYFVILAGGRRQDIRVGLQNDEGVEVVEGLTEHQKIEQVNFSELRVGTE